VLVPSHRKRRTREFPNDFRTPQARLSDPSSARNGPRSDGFDVHCGSPREADVTTTPENDALLRRSLPGEVLVGRYEVVRSLGMGSRGVVFEAHDRETGEQVAIKMLRRTSSGDDEAVERFRREAMVLLDLRHPSIVGVMDLGVTDDGHFFLVMELISGRSLAARLEQQGALEPAALLPIVHDVAEALEVAHRNGVIHRDIRPQNILLPDTQAVGVPRAKVVDFGLAKVTWDAPMTGAGVSLGMLRYAAPEQLGAASEVDQRADVYSLGVVIFEALAGPAVLPFPEGAGMLEAVLAGEALPLSARRPGLGDALDAVIARAIARDREARHGSARELARAFGAALTDPPPASDP